MALWLQKKGHLSIVSVIFVWQLIYSFTDHTGPATAFKLAIADDLNDDLGINMAILTDAVQTRAGDLMASKSAATAESTDTWKESDSSISVQCI